MGVNGVSGDEFGVVDRREGPASGVCGSSEAGRKDLLRPYVLMPVE